MTIDRRTFLAGGCAAAAGGALVSLSAIAAVGQVADAGHLAVAAPVAAASAGQAAIDLRILGWDQDDGIGSPGAQSSPHGASWLAIDQQWRGSWH
jgi:hypothetical protein